MKIIGTTVFLTVCCSIQLFSQDLVGGTLSSNQLESSMIELTARLYVDDTEFERPFLIINSGQDTLYQVDEEIISDDLSMIVYQGQRTYPSENGEYQFELVVENWISGISNIVDSNTKPLKITHTTRIMEIYPLNSMPLNESNPDEIYFDDGTYYYQPNFTNSNNAEYLIYSLTESDIEGYSLPNNVSVNQETGLIVFTPEDYGKFVISIRAEKYLIDFDNPDIPRGETELLVLFNADTTISTDEIVSTEGVQLILYPQPACDQVFFKSIEGIESEIDYMIYDLSGRLIERGHLSSVSMGLDVTNLQNQEYIVFLVGDSFQKAAKLVVEH